MSIDQGPNRVDIPVRRVEVTVTVDDVLNAIAQHADTIAQTSGQPLSPQGAAQVQKLRQLAAEMKGVVNELAQLNPVLHAQPQRGGPGGSDQ